MITTSNHGFSSGTIHAPRDNKYHCTGKLSEKYLTEAHIETKIQ